MTYPYLSPIICSRFQKRTLGTRKIDKPRLTSSSNFSIVNGTFNHSQWVIQMNELLHREDLAAASQSLVSVYKLPDSVRDGDPAAYLPRRVAFGPYHHFLPELSKMDLFKLDKAKNLKWRPQIQELADHLKTLELTIRVCFDQSIEMDGQTLSWVVLIDGLYLLELLHRRYYSRPLTLPLHIFYKKLWSESEIISDMLKLENQIPLLVLKEILPEHNYKYDLTLRLYKFSMSVSPFELPCLTSKEEILELYSHMPEIYNLSHHLLHFLYFVVVLIPYDEFASMVVTDSASMPFLEMGTSVNLLSETFYILGSSLHTAFIQHVKQTYGIIQRLLRLLGYVANLKLNEKIIRLIPSASDLKQSGFTFKSTKNGILKCGFDETTLTLTLSSIHLDGFSRVLLKNLVAFEALAELNPPCLLQYITLINGLLKSSKDLEILKQAGIVYNHLNSEEEALELFNDVVNSISRLKKASVLNIHLQSGLDMEITSEFLQDINMYYDMGLKRMDEKINKSYERCWRSKMKKFVSVVFKGFAILFILLLIVLVIAQFLCHYLSCPGKIFQSSIASLVKSPRLLDSI